MKPIKLNINRLWRVVPLFGAGVGIGLMLALMLANSPPLTPPDPALKRAFRPNISSLDLPEKLDFCGEPMPLDDPNVRKRMDREFLLNLQWDGQVMLYLKRSGEFFPMFEKILKEENVPDDLKYLSVAESALYMAQSPKGAVGLWQFIEATGRRYGLQIDDYVDERRHPEKSTRAAIRLLKDNKERFGTWALSATAYNMGEGATEDDLTFQQQESHYDLYLNEETSRYIFRIVAIKEILSHPERYGYYLKSDDYYHMPASREVVVSEAIPNLATWAASQGTSYQAVKLLNPWIRKRLLPTPSASDPYVIKVPINNR
jgi:hypothetical protein